MRDGVVRAGVRLDRARPRPGAAGAGGSGLVTGWHAPGASHLDLLRGGRRRPSWSSAPTRAALRARYLWHEFGDSCLLLP